MNESAARKRKEGDSSIWVVILLALVLAAIMVLAVTGGTLFRHITVNRSANMDKRAALSYISSRVLAADQKDRIEVLQGEEGSVLRIGDVYLSLKDGYLCESDSPLDQEASGGAASSAGAASTSGVVSSAGTGGSATSAAGPHVRQIARAGSFDLSLEDGLLTVTTDQGSREIYLHSEEAGS